MSEARYSEKLAAFIAGFEERRARRRSSYGQAYAFRQDCGTKRKHARQTCMKPRRTLVILAKHCSILRILELRTNCASVCAVVQQRMENTPRAYAETLFI